ncbi:futalosine hydrolase [Salipaludibacillus sp. CUR1]|uniref:futalosine hydrolase n=1 Tax=Salipaludibacillus sp. CUR1 TaxID=2820003 RepID=UPI001E33BBF9|nr:futalosine hydrolase [Salipaludibacillus sp. CUR1]MCE7794036.1 futalosine hydrolase [Salipaludibacillus sp. CUR1]
MNRDLKRMTDPCSVLIVTSVEAEKEAILKGLQSDHRFQVETIGVGPVAAAARTALLLGDNSYKAVINMGVAGGIPSNVQIGDAVIASEIIAGDLGAESPEGFKPLEELGFGVSRLKCDNRIVSPLKKEINNNTDITVHTGAVLTLSTVTGSAETLERLKMRFPEASAEAMEGFGAATAADLHGVPFYEIRTISNAAGPRNKNAWRLKDALTSLTIVSECLKEVF